MKRRRTCRALLGKLEKVLDRVRHCDRRDAHACGVKKGLLFQSRELRTCSFEVDEFSRGRTLSHAEGNAHRPAPNSRSGSTVPRLDDPARALSGERLGSSKATR